MKKTLFALAAVGAFAGAAQAQSSVSVYGIMDGSYTATENKGNTTSSAATTTVKGRNTVNGDGALSTSRIGFRGVEDLGKGQRAEFLLEYDLVNIGAGATGNDIAVSQASTNVSNSSVLGWGARESWIGISDSKLGGLRLGRQQQPVFGVLGHGLAGAGNNIAGSVYSSGSTGSSPLSASVRPVSVYVDQAITYISPNMGGVTVQVQTSQNAYSASDTTASTGATESGGSITFTGVKNLVVAYGIAQQSGSVATVTGTTSLFTTTQSAIGRFKTVQQALSANYNFGPAHVFANATSVKTNNMDAVTVIRDQSAYEIGVRAPLTPIINVWASAFSGDRKMDADAANLSNLYLGRADISGYQLGATYAFSKRTTAYAIYGTQDVKGKAAASGAKISSEGYALGLRHTF
jgi:predicted porin